ncbi:MAG: hypothetical protein PHU25_01730 [Deltaproteobacteria bacterium]|nr:hypothetical protein [Deltaproteobacteria bacterium]
MPGVLRKWQGYRLRMPTIKCHLCGEEFKASFYDFWTCGACGFDCGIRLHEHAPDEMGELLAFFEKIRATRSFGSSGSVLALMKTLEKPEDTKAFSSCIDTLLLFFDSLVVPSITIETLARALGDKKLEVYQQHGLLKCSDISFVQAQVGGVDALGGDKQKALFNLDLIGDALPVNAETQYGHSRYELAMSLANLEHVILNELVDLLKERNLFNAHRIGNTEIVRLRGRDYVDRELAHLIPYRFLRSEVFCHFFSFSMLYDQHYGIANVLKETRFVRGWAEGGSEYSLFHQWLRTTSFTLKVLEPLQVLEFRSRHGSLTGLVSAIQKEAITRRQNLGESDQAQAFGREIEERIRHFRKVKGKGHERKAIYLTGLLSTLGSLLNGPLGAVIGGIGGTIAADLALEFDRKTSGPIGFVVDEFLAS